MRPLRECYQRTKADRLAKGIDVNLGQLPAPSPLCLSRPLLEATNPSP